MFFSSPVVVVLTNHLPVAEGLFVETRVVQGTLHVMLTSRFVDLLLFLQERELMVKRLMGRGVKEQLGHPWLVPWGSRLACGLLRLRQSREVLQEASG